MELKECVTCGSHDFTDNKCDYCGNQYEATELYTDDNKIKLVYGNTWCDNGTETYAENFNEYSNGTELNQILDSFEDKKGNELAFKIMVWTLLSIIWFAVTVFIPPLFLITICGLIIWVCRKVCKKY